MAQLRLGTTGIASRPRVLEPEWLDALPAADARAVRSRRDLVRVNAWMGHARIMRRLLETPVKRAVAGAAGREPSAQGARGAEPPRSLLELGGGDGTFLLRVARRLAPRWPQVAATLVDRRDTVADRTRAGFRSLGWSLDTVTADVFDYLRRPELPAVDIVAANLFLHHLDDRELGQLFARLAPLCSVLVACEPRRSTTALAGSRCLGALGCNDVSRHDAVASVRAGFAADELSRLWPGRGDWQIEERPAGLFTHAFAARRLR